MISRGDRAARYSSPTKDGQISTLARLSHHEPMIGTSRTTIFVCSEAKRRKWKQRATTVAEGDGAAVDGDKG